MTRRPIGFLDSGIGGLPYLARTRELAPGEDFAYLADTVNFPYGEKSAEVLSRLVADAARALIAKRDPKILVVACNTASVVALERLRSEFDLPIVGTVPAIKPAAARSRNKRIGILATSRTVRDGYVDRLVEQYASDCEVIRIAGKDITDFVERRFFEASENEKFDIIEDAVSAFKDAAVDEIVLGCTHYLYLADQIRQRVGEGVEVVDSRNGVSRRTVELLQGEHAEGQGRSVLYVTGGRIAEENYRSLAESFGMEYGGVL